jgi:hypothetical protein
MNFRNIIQIIFILINASHRHVKNTLLAYIYIYFDIIITLVVHTEQYGVLDK